MADWPLIGVRFALYLTMAALFGLSAFSFYTFKPEERSWALPLTPWLASTSVLALLLTFGSIALMAAEMAGSPPWPIDRGAIEALLTGSSMGLALKVRMAALMLAVMTTLLTAGTLRLTLIIGFAGSALATLAWAGHGTMDEGTVGWIHLAADILHLLAAGTWVGALLALMLLVIRPIARVDANHLSLTHRALHGFGNLGTIVVGTIAATGSISAWRLVGFDRVASLGTSVYGQLLIAKIGLFGVMLGLASLNRFYLTRAFECSVKVADPYTSLRVLRVSLAVEAVCAVVILMLVAYLGTLEPPAAL